VTDTQFIAIGKIIGAHGIKGNLKIHSYAESLSPFEAGTRICVKDARGWEKKYHVKWVKPHSKGILLAFKGVDDRASAEKLIGSRLLIERETLPELEADAYYWSDLIGLSVFSKDEDYIGRIKAVLPTGSNDVYVVESVDSDHKEEVLIPALKSVVLDVDLEKQVMIVDLPDGL
jgi:16S rRNA processing protein RimM